MDVQFEKFVQFCEGHLGSSSMKLLDLVKKRYKECDREYKQSHEFFDYMLCTEAKIESDKSRFFVHLRDFLNILKENKADDVEEDINWQGINGVKRVHESNESESVIIGPSKRRKVEENERENESEQSSEDSSSDQEIEREPGITEHAVEDNEQSKYDSDIETYNSDSLTEEGSDTADFQEEKNDCDKRINIKKFHVPVDLPEFDNILKVTKEDKTVELLVKSPTETNDSQSEIFVLHETNETKAMFSSTEDEDSEVENKTAMDIESIIKRHEDNKLGYETQEEIQTNINIHGKTEKEKQKCFQSLGTKGLPSSESATKIHNGAKFDETESMLNTSSESVVILEESDEDSQYEQREMRDNTSICSENLENKDTCCKSLMKLKALSRPDETKCKNTDLNSSEEVTIIDNDSTEADNQDDALIGDDTKYFGENADTEYDSENAEEETEKRKLLTGERMSEIRNDDFSSDEEDPSFTATARRFREKCKKKYVVSVGKKIKGFSSHSSDHLKPPSADKSKKDRNPVKKRRSNNSPKCKKRSSPKKSSPSKSPIIIMTDSESGSDADNIEGFKKKFDEKVNTKFRKKFQIEDDPAIVVEKLSVKFEPMEVNDIASVHDKFVDNDESSRDSCKPSIDQNDDLVTGNKENTSDGTSRAYDSDSKKLETTLKGKEKTRVNFITEELYNSKPDRKFEDLRKQPKEVKPNKFEISNSKDRNKMEKLPLEQKAYTNEPGTSYASDGENAKKKGSNKQIRRLEALLEKGIPSIAAITSACLHSVMDSIMKKRSRRPHFSFGELKILTDENIRNQIEKVRTRELDLEELDSEISDYILEDKLQRKFMKIWEKLCELHKATKSTGRPTEKYFKYQGTRYPEINRKIEKFLNKRKVFPDYHDIRNIITKVNKDKRLHLRSREIDDLSREAFTDVGNQLQRRRQKDFVATFHTPGAEVNPFSLYDDPALYDTDLKKKLDANKKSAKSNMDKVVEKYAALQYQVGDKTDEEDDDDEEDDENDTNTGIEDLDQISGVDNSDSDNSTAPDAEHVFCVGHGKYGSHKTLETGPCLEIENVESGKKSTFSNENPDDVEKLSPMKSRVEHKRCDWSPKHAHFNDQLGLCPMPSKKYKNGVNVTLTILSDNDDDNEVKCPIDKDKDDLADVNEDHSASVSDNTDEDSTALTDSNRTHCTANDSSVEGNTDVKNVRKVDSQVSVTVITDDEDEEGNISDQSLELKIVSACHLSLDDISKLHVEGDIDVAEDLYKSSRKERDLSKDFNKSGGFLKPSVKFDLELGKEMKNKTMVLEDVEKPSTVNTLPCQSYNERTETPDIEPEVMIIEDIETEQVPLSEKDSNFTSGKIRKFTWETEVLPECSGRHRSEFREGSKTMDGCSKVKVPLKTHSSKCDDVVIIDYEDTKERTKIPLKSCKLKTISHSKFKSISDVICIDTVPENEIDSEYTKTETNATHRTNYNSTSSRPQEKSPLPTTNVSIIPQENETGSDAVKHTTEEHNSFSQSLKVDNTVELIKDDEVIESGMNVERFKMGKVKAENSSLVREEIESSEDIFAASYGIVESNEYSTIELCDDSEVFEIPDQSDLKQKHNYDFIKGQNVDTERSVAKKTNGAASSGETFSKSCITQQNNEKDVTLTNLNELTENETVDEISDEMKFEPEFLRKESLVLDEDRAKGDESLADSVEFTAVKLQTELVDGTTNAYDEESLEEEVLPSGVETDSETDRTVVENGYGAFGNNLGLCDEDVRSVLSESNSEYSVEHEINQNVNLAVPVLMASASEDEQEGSGGFEDEDKISSMFCETKNACDTEVKIKSPDIRNNFLQLKKAIVNSKPHLELKSQVNTQEMTSCISGSQQNAQWIEEDENASLIETYQEPDSAPDNLEENMISYSNSENIIVLSDSE